MLIDTSYFVGELHVPQVGGGASNKINNNDEFQNYIDQYEVDIMDMGLGKKTSKELFSVLHSKTGVINASADPKWTALIEGEDYQVDGKDYFWQGLRNKTGVLPRSIAAYYVYYKYMTDSILHKSTLGMVKAGADNSFSASAIPTLTRAWRNLYDWYGSGNCYYTPDVYVKKGVLVTDYFANNNNTREVSLFQYMVDKNEDFPDWTFTIIENKNQFQL